MYILCNYEYWIWYIDWDRIYVECRSMHLWDSMGPRKSASLHRWDGPDLGISWNPISAPRRGFAPGCWAGGGWNPSWNVKGSHPSNGPWYVFIEFLGTMKEKMWIIWCILLSKKSDFITTYDYLWCVGASILKWKGLQITKWLDSAHADGLVSCSGPKADSAGRTARFFRMPWDFLIPKIHWGWISVSVSHG